MSSALEQLRQFTQVVADTGEFDQMAQFKPRDATTNPSLILKACKVPEYESIVNEAVAKVHAAGGSLSDAMDAVNVAFGLKILGIVPGRVSTEVDARLSYDVEATVASARRISALYAAEGINASERVLIKISSTWEGLQACGILEAEGIHCNMTLLFALEQAAVAGENKATLISPFAGRITDFFKAKMGVDGFDPAEDPGVTSVRDIYHYMKKYGYATEVMGASFRNHGQCMHLAGCDLLTISPALLQALSDSTEAVPRRLSPASAAASDLERVAVDASGFLAGLRGNEMADTKLTQGIDSFIKDTVTLEGIIQAKLDALSA